MRQHGIPSSLPAPLFLFRDVERLKAHPSYTIAKAGDGRAAVLLVKALAKPLIEPAARAFGSGAMFVAPHAREATGENAIPMALASALAQGTKGRLDDEIVQANRVFHTGADPMERMNARAAYDGSVSSDARYVLVDDVLTMGGTLAELADYLQRHGARVAGVVILVNAARSGKLAPDERTIAKIKERFGDTIRDVFGIDPAALTAEEAQYLIGFRTPDEIRYRSIKAAEETARRLYARGIRGLGAEGADHPGGAPCR